jgi:hypothetical protein
MYKKTTRDTSKCPTWRKSEMQRHKDMFPLATTILTKDQHSIQATSSRKSSKLHPGNEILPCVFMSSLRTPMLHGKVHPILSMVGVLGGTEGPGEGGGECPRHQHQNLNYRWMLPLPPGFFYENLRFMIYKSVTCKNNSIRYWKRPKT